MGYFIGGLRSEIRNGVRTLRPKNRYEAMQIARDIEAKLVLEEDDDDVGGSR